MFVGSDSLRVTPPWLEWEVWMRPRLLRMKKRSVPSPITITAGSHRVISGGPYPLRVMSGVTPTNSQLLLWSRVTRAPAWVNPALVRIPEAVA